MGVTVSQKSNCVVITVSGVLFYEDLLAAQNTAKTHLNTAVKVNCLILADQFAGWGNDGDWGDLTFLYESDPMIGKIAIVAKDKWRDELLMFLGAGRRQAAVEFFFPDEGDQARGWLSEHVE